MEEKELNKTKEIEQKQKEKKLISNKAKTATISTLISFIIGILSSIISSISLFTDINTESKYSQIFLIGIILFAALTLVYFISKYLQKNKSKSPVFILKDKMITAFTNSIDNSIYNPKFEKEINQ